MDIDVNPLLKNLSLKCETRKVPLSNIKVDFTQQDRKDIDIYMEDPRYEALMMTMDSFGQYQNIILRKKEGELFLISGFLRFNRATDLGWNEIEAKVYSDITDYQAYIIQMTENQNRISLTSYDNIMKIGRIKDIWETQFPHTKRGKYFRSSSKSIIPDSGNMLSQNDNSIPSFVKAHHKYFGISKSTLYNKTRIYDAIVNNVLSKKTIARFRRNEIGEDVLLKRLKHIENLTKTSKKKPTLISDSGNNTKDKFHNSILNEQKTQVLENVAQFDINMRKAITEGFNETGKEYTKVTEKISSPKFNQLIHIPGISKNNKSINIAPQREDILTNKSINPLLHILNTPIKITRDIFEITTPHLEFLLYLYYKHTFLLEEINSIFEGGYDELLEHAKYWEEEGFIIQRPISTSSRAQKHKYSLSAQTRKNITQIFDLIKGLDQSLIDRKKKL